MHGWLLLVGVVLAPAQTFWDVDLYRWWAWQGLNIGVWQGIDTAWVYPIGAFVPMLLSAVGGTGYGHGYALAWSLWVTVFDALGVVALLHAPRLVGNRQRSTTGAWWWIGFTFLLGPVAMGRLDAVVAPMVIAALVLAIPRPRLAAALLTLGAWVKVAPGALLLAVVPLVRRPWRDVVVPALLVCAAITAFVWAVGGLEHLGSFLTEQHRRGLQVEAVGATPWVLAALFTPRVTIGLNEQITTWEIYGPGTQWAADALGAAFVVGLGLVGAFLWWCSRRAGDRLWADRVLRAQLLTRGALLVATTLIVFNKVGSPQYLGWVAPPVAVALALRLPGWRGTSALVAGLALATQVIFPIGYTQLVTGGPGMALVLAARNVGLVVLAVTCVVALLRISRAPEPPAPQPAPGAADRPDREPAGTPA
ncbi:glycosyltransferase 87 family protein [Cellulomonas composti]|uniref:DUF2029 domain-containing protein n=1 Tax=Cellulomonas composti TaxID=266130 RepID=A0A511J8D7_9CELL|nr:glycosyltransferase 87 family protein [Cellulomonas composti]GEL93973.1 hypothetical protein CCO02nite_06310 [Cellulomonas composti]